MCIDLDDQENKWEAVPRKFAFPIEAYANRIKLKARLELSSSESAMIMFDILAKKKVPLVKATNAVQEILDAATNNGYATQRFDHLDMIRKQGMVLLDELIAKFSTFVDAISKLPPNSKAILNQRIAGITKNGGFDTEVFAELLDSVADCLPQLSPKKLANEALLHLLAETPCWGRPDVIGLWEAIPSITRSSVERKIEASLPQSGVALLRSIPTILKSYRPSIRLGAPASPNFQFVKEANRIWSSFGLKSGRRYDHVSSRHVSSAFQRFCNAALEAAGHETRISDRQIANLKRKPIVKIK
jgi:hypothetical protein